MKGDLFGYGTIVNGYYGGGTAGRSRELTHDKWGAAMAYCTVPDINRAVDLLCNAIDALPYKIIYNPTPDKKNDQAVAESTDALPRHDLLKAFREVNNDNNQSFMWESLYSLLVFGENFIEPLISKLSLRCTGLNMLNALGMSVVVAGGRIQSFLYSYPGGGGSESFLPHELVYDKTKNPFDQFRGLSKVAVAMTKINILRDEDRFLDDYFKNNGVPDVVVSPKGENKFSPIDTERLHDQMRNNLKGAGNQHRGFISPVAADWLQLDQTDLDKQYAVNDPLTRAVYRVFGIPLSMAGDDAGTQYKAGDPVRVGFYQNTIIPAAKDIARFINFQVMPLFDETGFMRFEFDTTEFDQVSEDDQLRSQVATQNYKGGIWKLNEARTYTKKDAVSTPEGDDFYQEPAPNAPIGNAPLSALPADSAHALQTEFLQAMTGDKTDAVPPTADMPPMMIPGKATQSTPEDELRAWERKALKNWKAGFEAVHLKGDVSAFIQQGISASSGDSAALKMVFKEAGDLLQMRRDDYLKLLDSVVHRHFGLKAYADTRQQFVGDMLRVIDAGQKDETTRRKFAAEIRSLLRKYGLIALRDGMNAVGYDPESLSQKELNRFRQWQDEQSGYVTHFGAEMFKQGITENEIAIRANMWADVSLRSIYIAGVTLGDGNRHLVWKMGKAEQHCPDCLKLNGQVHTAEEWELKNLRPGVVTCGPGCDCGLELTDQPPVGNWLA